MNDPPLCSIVGRRSARAALLPDHDARSLEAGPHPPERDLGELRFCRLTRFLVLMEPFD